MGITVVPHDVTVEMHALLHWLLVVLLRSACLSGTLSVFSSPDSRSQWMPTSIGLLSERCALSVETHVITSKPRDYFVLRAWPYITRERCD